MSSKEYFRIGVISGIHGLDGCLKVHIITDFPERFSGDVPVYVNIRGHYKAFTVTGFTIAARRTGYLYLKGIDDVEAANAIKGCELFVDSEDAQIDLDSDSFHYSAIIGCQVYYNSIHFGNITDIVQTGAADTLVVKTPEGKEYLIPFVESMVSTQRIDERILEIFPIEGLIE
ncbi:MAG: ribosome maturation factor RimM [Spirochaetes bacterium]|nr:ribosome maturation factor RimM [Spirochaetota bacterium]